MELEKARRQLVTLHIPQTGIKVLSLGRREFLVPGAWRTLGSWSQVLPLAWLKCSILKMEIFHFFLKDKPIEFQFKTRLDAYKCPSICQVLEWCKSLTGVRQKSLQISAISFSSRGHRTYLTSMIAFLHNGNNSYLMDLVCKLNKTTSKKTGTGPGTSETSGIAG